jgi:metal-responsive CopG/Arc/MetJ family transcriptional regulator
VKTAISIPDETFRRVDAAARRLQVSRSEFFVRAAERWLASLEADSTTQAINRALGHGVQDTAFTAAAATSLGSSVESS